MRCFRSPWWLPSLGLLVACVGWLASASLPEIVAQQKGKKLTGTAEQLLKVGPRPQRPALPPSELPLQFIPHERIALVGNSTAERMNLFGHFETLVQMRFAKLELVIRNFGRPADEVAIRQRSNDYTRLDDPLYAFNPDTFLCFFGWNESFAGPEGVEKFKGDYERFLDEYTNKYPRDDAKSKPRFVLVSPLAFESAGDTMLPGGAKENANLKLYADAVKAVAAKRKLAFVDLYTPTLAAFNQEPGLQFTINGCHANEKGDALIGTTLEGALFGSATRYEPDSRFERLRAAINDKSWMHLQDYRMVNGWYVYGGRRTWDTETFPGEYLKIRNMAAVRDRYVWDLAQGKQVAAKPDDSETGELFTPQTRFGDPRQKYSEAPELRYLTPQQLIESCTTPPGTKIELFADETRFPELAKPVQLNFDGKGRLWVSCMPSYPQWQPGMPKANDKLVILEDTNGDGKADKSTVFYDQLHCPTGFEFWNGGVLVVDQPRLLFLKDTNGDDKADLVIHLLDGWATDDTHHTCGAFEWSNGGLLHMLEGIATSTTLETPWGPHRNTSGGAYVFDPRTLKIRHFLLPGQYNSWCYVFDEWGQGIVGDGTTSNHHWDTPLSGAMISGRKGMNTVFNNEGMRPALGCEWLVSRALPDSIQKHFTYACVINMNGMPRIDIRDDGAGFAGKRLKLSDGKPDDLIRSTDKHFRPADPQIGPDGALWFGDWANALIGHMQYSQRDPNRDHTRGRIYRLVATDKPLVKPVTQFGKSNAELFEQFREYEWRTRYRARRELRDRPAKELLADLQKWVASLNPSDPVYDRLLCEALWLQQSFHAVSDELLQKVLAAKTPQARAAATHVLSDEREWLPNAQAMLIKMAEDDHPRVRTEAMRGLSFFATPEAIAGLVATAKKPLDYWARYTLEVSLSGHENLWRAGYLTGKLTADNPEAKKLLGELLAANKAGGAALPHIVLLLSQEEKTAEQRNKAMTALASMTGNPNNGRAVFVRNCTACHRVGNGEGQEYGPNLDKVATRLAKYKLVESIIDPNAEVDQKYQSTRIDTVDGKTITGLVVSETPKEVVIFDGKEKKTVKVDDIDERTQLKQSSMPEGQAGAMSPAEFLDLIEYLSRLK